MLSATANAAVTAAAAAASEYDLDDDGVLWSLRYYQELRARAGTVGNVLRNGNVDVFVDPNTAERVALCNINLLFPYTAGEATNENVFGHHVAVQLAAQHLNAGDGTVVPQLDGLHNRCPVRFTVEHLDNHFAVDNSLKGIIDLENRHPQGTLPGPCAIIGEFRSSITVPAATVTGVLGYPQVSSGSTSPLLDDKSQFPLFGRTIPSDTANAVPLIYFFANVLHAKHLAVINVNDEYGNSFVNGMRHAAEVHAPQLQIVQFPVTENDPYSVNQAVQALRDSKIRLVFGLANGDDFHDLIMQSAYEAGVAGNGLYNWFFGDAFPSGFAARRTFVKGSPLDFAYRGIGLLEVTGGLPGMPAYDNYVQHLNSVKNPTDLKYLNDTSWPPHHDPPSGPFIEDESFLTSPSSFNPFTYEAMIALGLSACTAITPDLTLKGQDHHHALALTTFQGITGNVAFNNVTASRDPSSTMYRVDNFLVMDNPNNASEVVLQAVLTHLFQNSSWETMQDFVFNDGTTNLPADIAPVLTKDSLSVPYLAGGLALCVVILGFLWAVIREHRRKSNDSVWKVKKEELKFADPPAVLGSGTFGLVLLAEYRGTQVAVKRVIPRKINKGSSFFFNAFDAKEQEEEEEEEEDAKGMTTDEETGMKSAYGVSSGMGSWGTTNFDSVQNKSGLTRRGSASTQTYRKLKEEFMEEMRHLSRLRHPCITTVMGAVIDKKEEPMLVLEYMDHGSLYDILHNDTMFLDGEIVMPILRDVTQGVRFLHSATPEVIHGDLKSHNILVDSRLRAKVADFGLAQKKQLGGTGTPFWMAPELLRCESPNTTSTDVYSFGIILYEVYSRKDPYEGESAKAVLDLVVDRSVRKRPTPPPSMPEKIKSLMADCLEDEPKVRPSFEELDTRLKRIGTEIAEQAPTRNHVSLFDIFPRKIAEALRDGRKPEAEHKDCVTIFFSDIVKFTDISSTLDPHKVANMLDRLYQKFDELSTKHDCYKVETIGDAYMAVTNLVKDQSSDHVKRIAEFAIDAIKAANETLIDVDDPSRGHVAIRVGFHSGPVVADVVGNRNPRYCLFGDAVNTASRMESNSRANRINCSEKSALLLLKQSPEMPTRSRGELPIKGKGKMKCFWVNEVGNSIEATNAVERVRAKQQHKLLQLRQNKQSDGLQPITEASAEFTSSEFGSDEFRKLDDKIKNRLKNSSAANPRATAKF